MREVRIMHETMKNEEMRGGILEEGKGKERGRREEEGRW